MKQQPQNQASGASETTRFFCAQISPAAGAAGELKQHKKEPHMANRNTNPGIGETTDSGVMHNPQPSRARTHARVVDRRDIKDIPCSQTARACTCTRTRVENPAAYFKAWRLAKWGGDFDPVRVAVDEAVASFSTKNPDADRRIWLKIANRVGADAFMDAVWQKQSEIGHDRTCLRDSASAFQALLNERFPKPASGKGGVA